MRKQPIYLSGSTISLDSILLFLRLSQKYNNCKTTMLIVLDLINMTIASSLKYNMTGLTDSLG